MRSVARIGGVLAAGLLTALFMVSPSSARAQGAARFEVLVASVSTGGGQVDGALRQMAADFKRNGLAFTSYKLVNSTRLQLAPGQSGTVPLPGGKATLLFVARDPDGKHRVKVTSPGSSAELSMSDGGEAYVDAGSQGSSKIFIVVRR